ncbi:MAG: U32 family peptidase [Gammaproteobacteria bacterium]|nr:U32 family peptidase [Gammaproteobacteria bacterium]
MTKKIEIVCPAGTLSSLKAAVDNGADTVYCGFRDTTNARNFPGLNFSRKELEKAVDYAKSKSVKVLTAINTYPEAGNLAPWHQAVDDAQKIGVDAIILADIGLANYTSSKYGDALNLHLSVQASASTAQAINFYQKEFGIKRVVLPRVLSFEEIKALNSQINIETEIFAFGGLCVMAEGRCTLSHHTTGISPNRHGVCSPASHIQYIEHENGSLTTKLGEFVINRFEKNEAAGYPTTCKGRYIAEGREFIFEKNASLNIIPEIKKAVDSGVSAFKIEGRQRGKAYVANITAAFRKAVDAIYNGEELDIKEIETLMEGLTCTAGAYKKSWQ